GAAFHCKPYLVLAGNGKFCSRTCAQKQRVGRPAPGKPPAHFWNRIDKNGPIPPHRPKLGPCWVWTGYVSKTHGYGICHFRRHRETAHRVAFFLHFGRWPEPQACHHCDNKICCRPDHLFEGTSVDNQRDKVQKGREAKGSGHGLARLTELSILSVRDDLASGMTQTDV